MSWYKESQQRPSLPQFESVDVRRMHGILTDFKEIAAKAEKEMSSWIDKGELNISFEEAKNRLSYELTRLGLRS